MDRPDEANERSIRSKHNKPSSEAASTRDAAWMARIWGAMRQRLSVADEAGVPAARRPVESTRLWRLWLLPGALAAGVIAYAATLPGDANWDLRNYHLYNPFALFAGRLHFDVAPAGIQTFLPPMLDVPYYLLQKGISSLRSLNALLAVPHAVAVVLAYAITLLVIPKGATGAMGTHAAGAPWLAAVAAVYGATGVAGFTTLATTQSEMIPVSLVLGAVWLALASMGTDTPPARRMALCGLLCGAAAGLKLTTAYAGVGFGAGLLLLPGVSPRARLAAASAFSAGAVAGACAVGGHWWLTLYEAFGNPFFPFLNGVFRSPWMIAANLQDPRFLPRTALQWIAYPFHWAVTPSRLVGETPVRDPRFALALLALLAILARRVVRRPAPWSAVERRERFLLVFFAVGFLLWEVQFSVLRYLAGLELLTGTVLILAARPWLGRLTARPGLFAAAAFCALIVAVTQHAGVERAPPSRKPVDVLFPPVPPDSLVLLLDQSPMAYTAAFAPRTVRFLGVGNWVVGAASQGLFRERAEGILRGHTGPIWGMEHPGIYPGEPEATLAAYGLRRTQECARVLSNLDGNGLRLCRLERAPERTPG